MKCSKCDADITKDDEFCPECGTKVKHGHDKSSKSKNDKKHKSISKLWWILPMIILVLVTIVLFYMYLPKCGDGKITKGEDCASCPQDVKCNPHETCQNNKCIAVPFCGNSICDANETKCSCAQDCGSCSGDAGTCKEYTCEGSQCITKTKANCCGNGICESTESCLTCKQDCVCLEGKNLEVRFLTMSNEDSGVSPGSVGNNIYAIFTYNKTLYGYREGGNLQQVLPGLKFEIYIDDDKYELYPHDIGLIYQCGGSGGKLCFEKIYSGIHDIKLRIYNADIEAEDKGKVNFSALSEAYWWRNELKK